MKCGQKRDQDKLTADKKPKKKIATREQLEEQEDEEGYPDCPCGITAKRLTVRNKRPE